MNAIGTSEADPETRIRVQKVNLKGEGNTTRGVWEGNRGLTPNRRYVIKANYYHGQVELNTAGKLLDVIQNTHFKIVPLRDDDFLTISTCHPTLAEGPSEV